MSETEDLVAQGLRAWTEGDLDALEAILDPAVTLRWIEPGDWDCNGRDEVMDLLRERQAEGAARWPTWIEYVDAHTIVVSTADPGPNGAHATRITVAGGVVVAMQQYASRDDALVRPGRPEG